MKQISPDTHPNWLQRYMPALNQELRQTVRAIEAAETLGDVKSQMLTLAAQVQTLNAAVHALVNHVARSR